MTLDPAVTAGAWDVGLYRQKLGDLACLIGEADHGYLLLAMTARGYVYGGFDETLWHLGDSGEEAIETLCSGRKLEAPI